MKKSNWRFSVAALACVAAFLPGAAVAVTLHTSDGDFNGSVVAEIQNGLSGAANYNYVQSRATGFPIEFDTDRNTGIFFISKKDGVYSVGTIFDRPDATGGRILYTIDRGLSAEERSQSLGTLALLDDPRVPGGRPNEGFVDAITGQVYNTPGAVFASGSAYGNNAWSPCCSDGYVVDLDSSASMFGFSLTPDNNGSVANSLRGLDTFLVYSFLDDGIQILDVTSTILSGGRIWFDFDLRDGGNGGGGNGDGGNGGGGEPVPEPSTLILGACGLMALRAKKKQLRSQ